MNDMTTATTEKQIHYPESDGKPMAETDVHIDALIYLREKSRRRSWKCSLRRRLRPPGNRG